MVSTHRRRLDLAPDPQPVAAEDPRHLRPGEARREQVGAELGQVAAVLETERAFGDTVEIGAQADVLRPGHRHQVKDVIDQSGARDRRLRLGGEQLGLGNRAHDRIGDLLPQGREQGASSAVRISWARAASGSRKAGNALAITSPPRRAMPRTKSSQRLRGVGQSACAELWLATTGARLTTSTCSTAASEAWDTSTTTPRSLSLPMIW